MKPKNSQYNRLLNICCTFCFIAIGCNNSKVDLADYLCCYKFTDTMTVQYLTFYGEHNKVDSILSRFAKMDSLSIDSLCKGKLGWANCHQNYQKWIALTDSEFVYESFNNKSGITIKNDSLICSNYSRLSDSIIESYSAPRFWHNKDSFNKFKLINIGKLKIGNYNLEEVLHYNWEMGNYKHMDIWLDRKFGLIKADLFIGNSTFVKSEFYSNIRVDLFSNDTSFYKYFPKALYL